jgi:ABC-type sugar transport system ATPase subunit
VSGVEIRGLHKSFGDVVVLDGFDLGARDRELLVVVGPSGCGKTTLLRCIAGLETADAGSIRIGGRDVTSVRPAARNVSMVFQSYALFPHLTVSENIGFGLVVREVRKREVRSRVDEAARLVGVSDLLDRRPYELSGGERQRVALARALVRRPEVYLLDEPLSNLDAGLRAQMRTELRALHREVGATTLHVTHDQLEALTLADRIAVVDGGRVLQVGTPDEVYGEPTDRFVAGFLGSPAMNFLEPDAARAFLPIPDGVLVGIRPEHLRLDDGPVVRTVELVEVAGSDAFVHVGGGLVAKVAAERRPPEGSTIRVGVAASDVHLFDLRSGRRVRR